MKVNLDCDGCIRRKTMFCPPSIECLALDDKPYYFDKNAALEEIERLNNIINNFEKWLEEYISLLKEPDIYEEQTLEDLKEVLDKLRELKGDSSNGDR